MYTKFVIFAFACFTINAQAKYVLVKNGNSASLVISATDQADTTIASGSTAVLSLDDSWSGQITALPVDAEVTEGAKTAIEFTFGDTDSYDISLLDGFNYGAKITATGATGKCTAVQCFVNFRAICPEANQVTNSAGTVVACSNSETIMAAKCPQAVVTTTNALNVQSCNSTSYLVIIS